MKNSIKLILAVLAGFAFTACEEPDPFVDRVVSPVLVQLVGENGAPSSGLSTDPTISSTFGESTSFGIQVLELDKTNILDYTKGIDSIPVTSLSLTIKYRGGGDISTLPTDGSGMAMVELPWSDFGITGAGESVSLMVSGSYKDQSFSKLFKLASN
ncbi:hypothetical protein [Jiulongibacter sediminis]|mgnify:CR=1 FL=1|uniref:hypothetical protein n=1 Tax=Jiulongibacter sediminis TaxID=1605367 RepID=UPI0026EF0D73|nr:hypothetical protein [Jiulongibacter sediminis]